MRSWTIAFALTGALGLSGAVAPAEALPLDSSKSLPQLAGDNDMKVDVHGWHCARRYAPGWGWHRHRGACGYRYGYAAPIVPFPFFFGSWGPRYYGGGYYHRPYYGYRGGYYRNYRGYGGGYYRGNRGWSGPGHWNGSGRNWGNQRGIYRPSGGGAYGRSHL